MREADLMRAIQLEASRRGARLFRNNVGKFRLEGGRWFHAGLGVGSSDLIGWTADGRFLAVEVKTPTGRVTKQQLQFIDAVRNAGGVAIVARKTGDLWQLDGTTTDSSST